MPSIISDEILSSAASGDVDALVTLDRHGLLMGGNESPEQFVQRLKTLRKNISAMDASLEGQGRYECDGITVRKDDRIPAAIFEEAAKADGGLYDFKIDWVPGFFIDPSFSFLFGGCAFYFYPDFFAMFIIRRSFRYRQRWLIYSRKELLAHELCHIARLGLESSDFEETFAYQTSTSSFRKLLGGLFLRQSDSFLFLGSTFLLLAAQILRTYLMPSIPIAPFWCLPFLIAGWLGLRYWHLRNLLFQAGKTLASIFGPHVRPVLFRCTDTEIRELASLANPQDWLKQKRQDSYRWKVIFRRFAPEQSQSR